MELEIDKIYKLTIKSFVNDVITTLICEIKKDKEFKEIGYYRVNILFITNSSLSNASYYVGDKYVRIDSIIEAEKLN